ncbi:hypothetical protein MSG28_014462 [Choristoneura fumiferana]|uniref:Uncharacterized protein n=1 Tax=Choristoneura fumiferana TaxID=7141 RepID=A0ACC0JRH6_CHOFU|nr:hypothetical protein MSG28_014462 [Choristoneura fumiferana]
MWLWCRWLVVAVHAVAALSPVIKIEARGGSTELAFKYAVYKINKERVLLPNSTLVYDGIEYIPARDSFRSYKKACNQFKSGAIALFSSGGPTLSAAMDALSRSLHTPHLSASADVRQEF